MTIRLIVGPARAGIGYGVYGIIGNLMATLVPLVGGMVMVSGETEADGQDMVCWYFAGLVRCSCFAQHVASPGQSRVALRFLPVVRRWCWVRCAGPACE